MAFPIYDSNPLDSLLGRFNTEDPTKQARLAQSLALLEAGGPSRVPVSFLQGLGMAGRAGMDAKRQAQKDAQAKLMQDMQLQQFTMQQEDAKRRRDQEAARQAAVQGFDPANPETWKAAAATGALPLSELMKQQGKTGLMQVGANVFDPQTRQWMTPPESAKTEKAPEQLRILAGIYGQDTPEFFKAARALGSKMTGMGGGSGGGGGGALPPGSVMPPKLKQGERWNPTLERVEAVPGSDLYIKQSSAHGKDFGALQSVETKMDNAVEKINSLLAPENKGAFESNFGGYNAYATQYLPGRSSDVRKQIESIKSDLKGAGLELMRAGGSIGQMTEREWPIVEAMISRIDPVLGEETARDELAKVAAYLERVKSNAREAYSTEWGNSQYVKPRGEAKPTAPKPANSGATSPTEWDDAKRKRYEEWKRKQGAK